jgi:outer membrane protein
MLDFLKKYYLHLITALLVIALLMLLITRKKTAYVETEIIIASYPPAQKVNLEIQEFAKPYNEKLEQLKIAIQSIEYRYKTETETLSKSDRTKLEKDYAIKKNEYTSYAREARQQISEYRKEKMAPVYNMINQYLYLYGDKYGYYIIHAATSMGNLVYASKSANLTEKVIKYIQKNKIPVKEQDNAPAIPEQITNK